MSKVYWGTTVLVSVLGDHGIQFIQSLGKATP